MRSARLASLQQAGGARSEQVWSLRRVPALCELCYNKLAENAVIKPGFLSRAYSFSRPESRGTSLRDGASSARNPRLSSMCHGAVTNRRPKPSHSRSGHRWRVERTHSVEMPSEENRGVTRWKALPLYKTSERFEQDCKMPKSRA